MTSEYEELIKARPELFSGTTTDTPVQIITDHQELLNLEKKLGQELGILYQDDYVYLLRDAVIFPDGTAGTYIRLLPRVTEDPVVILPVQEDRILLLSHFRHSIRAGSWELPRGFGTQGLTGEENAAKELFEETGASSVSLECLGLIHPDTGLLATHALVYLAQLSGNIHFECQDAREPIEQHRLLTPEEIKGMIQEGQITDSYTLSAFMLASAKGRIRI